MYSNWGARGNDIITTTVPIQNSKHHRLPDNNQRGLQIWSKALILVCPNSKCGWYVYVHMYVDLLGD